MLKLTLVSFLPSLVFIVYESLLFSEKGISIIIVPLLTKSETWVQSTAICRFVESVVEYLFNWYSRLTPGKLSQEASIVKELSPTKYLK